MSAHAERAAELYNGNFNCAQSVVTAFGDLTGLDEETSKRVACSFGGGMGDLHSVCGSLTGAFIVLGMLRGFTDATRENKRNHTARVNRLSDAFRERFGLLNCADLLRRNEEDGSAASEAKPCLKYVLGAVDILENFLEQENQIHV